VADAVLRALAEGTPADRIAISFGALDEIVMSAIRRVFSEIRIPLASDSSPCAADAPLARAALAALSFVEADPQRADLRALTDSPFVVRSDAALLRARRADRPSTWQDRIDSARALFADLCLAAEPTPHVHAALASDTPRASMSVLEVGAHAENARAWAALQTALDALEAAAARLGASRASVDSQEFLRAIEVSLRARSASTASARAGGVIVAELAELVGARVDVLVVIDANEGSLPSHPRVATVIGDELATRLREIDPARAPTSAAEHAAATYAALAEVAANAKRIAVIHRSEQVEGAPFGPSALVAWLVRNGAQERAWHAGPLAGSPLTPREANLRALAFQGKNRAIAASGETRRAETELARERFHAKKVASAVVGDVSHDPASVDFLNRAVASAERPLAITALEEMARCSFRGMSRAVLAVREIEEDGEAPDARARGQLVHEALRAAFAATMPLWRERPRDVMRIRSAALEAAAKTLAARRDEFSRTRETLHEVVRRQAMTEVTRIVDFSLDDLEFDPLLVEQSFGDARDPSGWPALVVSANGASASLRGKIDRVDTRHEARSIVRAVDYKTGLNAAKDAHRDLGDAVLQVPLYARAAMTSLDADRAEGLYLPARDIAAMLANRPKFEKAWDEIGAREKTRPELTERVLARLAPLREGRFLPLPRHDRECDRCAYDGICRRPRFVVSEEEEDESTA
ncbi:MAG: PD-(D/E)XK nuclease family protein, partial [Polyangiaceae bacterium]